MSAYISNPVVATAMLALKERRSRSIDGPASPVNPEPKDNASLEEQNQHRTPYRGPCDSYVYFGYEF